MPRYQGKLGLLRTRFRLMERRFEVQGPARRPKITVTADGTGVVSHVGSRLLADMADRTMLSAELSEALAGLRKSRTRQDPGQVLVDLAVAVAAGATTISDIAALGDQSLLVLHGLAPSSRR